MAKKGARTSGAKRARRGGRKNRKHGRQKRSLAFQRYWASGRLARRKIRNLMRCCGLSEAAARHLWEGVGGEEGRNPERNPAP